MSAKTAERALNSFIDDIDIGFGADEVLEDETGSAGGSLAVGKSFDGENLKSRESNNNDGRNLKSRESNFDARKTLSEVESDKNLEPVSPDKIRNTSWRCLLN